MKKLSIILSSLALTSTLFAQNTTGNQTNVNNEEQFENKIKQSSNFYINSDGLVVYKRSSAATQEEAPAKNDTTAAQKEESGQTGTYSNSTVSTQNQVSDTPVIIRKSAYDNNTSQAPSRVESDNSDPVITRPVKKEPVNYASSPEEPAAVPVRSSSVPPAVAAGAVKKEALTVDESIRINSRPVNVNSMEDETVNYGAITPASPKANETKTDPKKEYRKYSERGYEKRQPQYKSIEEAALAVEEMIDELKKKQSQTTTAKSMSSRLSTGANRAALRKKPLSNSTMNASGYGYTDTSAQPKPAETVQAPDNDWGEEPTYYINGTEVERADVEQLKKKDIVNKQFKIRNTTSGNPNGEVWYEVQGYSNKN